MLLEGIGALKISPDLTGIRTSDLTYGGFICSIFSPMVVGTVHFEMLVPF
jgi:hypothetical protein